MWTILRIFSAMHISLALVVLLARIDAPDCLRFNGDGFTQVIGLRTARVFSRPTASDEQRYSTTSPDNMYQGYL